MITGCIKYGIFILYVKVWPICILCKTMACFHNILPFSTLDKYISKGIVQKSLY